MAGTFCKVIPIKGADQRKYEIKDQEKTLLSVDDERVTFCVIKYYVCKLNTRNARMFCLSSKLCCVFLVSRVACSSGSCQSDIRPLWQTLRRALSTRNKIPKQKNFSLLCRRTNISLYITIPMVTAPSLSDSFLWYAFISFLFCTCVSIDSCEGGSKPADYRAGAGISIVCIAVAFPTVINLFH